MKMKVSRHQVFYFPPEALAEGVIVFPEDEAKHMAGSLRLASGDRVRATDGRGKFYEVEIARSAGRRLEARVLEVTEAQAAPLRVTIFQGIVRPQRMDLLVEKAAEMGVAAVVPVECARCVRGVTGRRLTRWRRIAREAMKQSLGAHLPHISEPRAFGEAAADLGGYDLVLAASEAEGGRALKDVVRGHPATTALWVGPEGGFTDEETGALRSAGALAFSLGPRRLRSETAALAALAALAQLV